MKHIYLFIYLLLCYNIAFSQCNNENDVIPEYLSNEGIAGQSFVANCSGRLTNLDILYAEFVVDLKKLRTMSNKYLKMQTFSFNKKFN